jgi:tetratricopeptide (TPR) repeat protein
MSFWLFRSGDGQGALIEAERALAMTPNLASAHLVRGAALSALGQRQEALTPLETSIRLDPFWDPSDDTQGSFRSRALPITSLRGCHRRGATADPYPSRSSALLPRALAAALGQLARTEEAEAALERAIAIGPASFDMYVRKARTFLANGEPRAHDRRSEKSRVAGDVTQTGLLAGRRLCLPGVV